MTPERWKQLDELLGAALDCPVSERASFLERACSGDEELRRELESLLNLDRKTGALIESPLASLAANVFIDNQPNPGRGERIAHYEVLGQIGSGGMGEVYLARDTGWVQVPSLLPPHLLPICNLGRASSGRRNSRRPSITRTSAPFTRWANLQASCS